MSTNNVMELEFSKTRIVYYDNKATTLTDKDIRELATLDTTDSESHGDVMIVKVEGEKHNWHHVPTNWWGLYCTEAEMQHLFHYGKLIEPVSIEATISHGIPISKTTLGTGSATNLSFNNTIYSLIADLSPEDSDFIWHYQDFKDDGTDWFKCFDGTTPVNNQRCELPKPTILYKCPATFGPISGNGTTQRVISFAPFARKDEMVTANYQKTKVDGDELDVTAADMKVAYYPEFLMNNKAIKALYPGENQDVFMYQCDSNQYSKIPCDECNFNEVFDYHDIRNTTNMGGSFNTKYFLNMPVFPQMRGPASNTLPQDSDYSKIANVFVDYFHAKNNVHEGVLLDKVMHGYKLANCYTDNLPQKWIKCLPVLDEGGNLIQHSVCATLTHTLKVKLNLKAFSMPRPYQFTNYYKIQENTSMKVGGQDGVGQRVRFTTGGPRTLLSNRFLTNCNLRKLEEGKLSGDGPTFTCKPLTSTARIQENGAANVYGNKITRAPLSKNFRLYGNALISREGPVTRAKSKKTV